MTGNIIDFHRRLERADAGWRNLMTGAGTRRAYVEQFDWTPAAKISKWQLDSMYEDHELVWKLVDMLPDDGLRKWIRFPTLDKAVEGKVKRILKQANFRQALNEALRMARLHGGAAIYLPIDDGQDDEQPVNTAKISDIGPADVIESAYVWPHELKRSLRFTHYCMSSEERGSHFIHRSRLIVIQGCRVSRDSLLANKGWGQSVIARALAAILACSIAHGAVPQILKDFILDVIKLSGLNGMALNTEQEDLDEFLDRIDGMSLAMSLLNKLALDNGDDIQRLTASVTGLSDLISAADRRLVAASGMPYQKLFGMAQGNAVGGSNADGQDREWNKCVGAYQSDVILPALEQFLLLVSAMIGVEDLEPEFCPLDAPTLKEQAETFKIAMEGAAEAVGAQIITPQEAASMVAGEQLKAIPVLNEDARAQLEDMTEEFLSPKAPPAPLQPGNVSTEKDGPDADEDEAEAED